MREGGLILTQPRTSVISFNEYSDIVVHSHFWISLQSIYYSCNSSIVYSLGSTLVGGAALAKYEEIFSKYLLSS